MWTPFRPQSIWTWGGTGGAPPVVTVTATDPMTMADHHGVGFHRKRMVIGMCKDVVAWFLGRQWRLA